MQRLMQQHQFLNSGFWDIKHIDACGVCASRAGFQSTNVWRFYASCFCVLFTCFVLIVVLLMPATACADDLDLPAWAEADEDIAVFLASIDDTKEAVGQASENLKKAEDEQKEAQEKVEDLQAQVEDMKATVKKVGGQLADQKQKSADALRLQYMLESSGFNLTDFIFSSTTLNEFVQNLEYMDHLQELNLAEIGRYAQMKAEYEQAQKDLETAEAAAAEEERLAQAQLEDAQKSLEDAQAAQATAEDELAAEIERRQKILEATGTIDDNVDWSLSKEDFIKEWGKRINNYLGGSPLGGTGEIFAEAAWNNHIDPRWSPAISCVESGKGSVCFLPHNAWGWGSSSWGSWEEAIKAHVAGLAKGYGYSVTLEKAMKYCPPNAQEWYVQCVNEMRSI